MSSTPSSLRRRRATGRWSGSSRVPVADAEVDHRRRCRRRTGRPRGRRARRHRRRRPEMPLNDTAIRSGSRSTGAMPTAASTRPQFGSEPNSAVLTRLSRATARATVERVVLGRPRRSTVTATRLVTPSASAISCAARSSHTANTAASSSLLAWARRRWRRRPAAARCRWWSSSRRHRAGRRCTRWPLRSAGSSCVGVGDGVGGEHARAWWPATARACPRPWPSRRRSTCPSLVQRSLLGHGVGGHDGVGGIGAAGHAAGHLVHDLGDAGQHLVHRQPVADQTGGTHRDLDRAGLGAPVAQRGGDFLGGLVGVLEAAGPGAGVGAAGIEHHRAQPTGGEHLLRPQHRRGLDLVAGEHAGGARSRGPR